MLAFTENELCITHNEIFETMISLKPISNGSSIVHSVCGMVKNQGEPGGGPFIVVNPDGTASSDTGKHRSTAMIPVPWMPSAMVHTLIRWIWSGVKCYQETSSI